MRLLSIVPLLLLLAVPLAGQITKPSMSPRAKLVQQVGLGEISIDYGRPSVRGRSIFGGQEAYGLVWRTGANASTKITFSEAAEVAGEPIEAGTYGLYTIPGEKIWTFILNRDAGLWGAGGYDPAKDALRVELPIRELPYLHESLTIDLHSFHDNGATLSIAWERTRLDVPIVVDSDTRVLAQIDERVRNAKGEVSARSYFDAGTYLLDREGHLAEAAGWIDRAVELSPDAFWMVYHQSEAAHRLGDLDKARASAERVLELTAPMEGGSFGYEARARQMLEKLDGAGGKRQ